MRIEGLTPDSDYLRTLFTTSDMALLRREVSWLVDEIVHAYPRFDTRLLDALREIAARGPRVLLCFLVVSLSFRLWHALQRLTHSCPWERLDPALFFWHAEFRVFAFRLHAPDTPATDARPPRYRDLVDFTTWAVYDYLVGYDVAGQSAQRRARLPRPLARPSVAACRVWCTWAHRWRARFGPRVSFVSPFATAAAADPTTNRSDSSKNDTVHAVSDPAAPPFGSIETNRYGTS